MPIIKSARKRVKVAAKAKARNTQTKRRVREALKAYAAALQSGKPAEVAKTRAEAMSALDTASKKAVIHKNKAARFKSKMAQQSKAAGVKPAAKPTKAKKATAVKAKTVKKTPSKAKKTTPKK